MKKHPVMSRSYEFVQLDVFTRTPLTGNPLAIVPDARGLTDQQMQALAREMNLSETTFVLPREPEVETKEGKRVRIFTVEEELPFAGHPTLGTALYLLSTAPSGADQVVLDLNVGKIGVQFSSDSNHRSDRVAGDVFGEMRQRDPEFGPTLPPDKIASVLGSEGSEIAAEWPSQVVSTGLPFAIVPIRDAKTFANLKPDLVRAGALLEGNRRPLLLLYLSGGTSGPARSARPDVFLWRRRSGHWIGCRLCRQLAGAARRGKI